MTVRIRLFAILRERAGSDSVEIELPDDATVDDALTALAELPPAGGAARAPAGADGRQPRLRGAGHPAGRRRRAGAGPAGERRRAARHVRVTEEPLAPTALAKAVGRPGRRRDRHLPGHHPRGGPARVRGLRRDGRGADRLDPRRVRRAPRPRGGRRRAPGGGGPLGEPSVVVAVSAAHREEAFAGAREAIDRIKAEAPIWKREVERRRREKGRWVEGQRRRAGVATRRARGRAAPTSTPRAPARMVDVGDKTATERRAVAEARRADVPRDRAGGRRGDGPRATCSAPRGWPASRPPSAPAS